MFANTGWDLCNVFVKTGQFYKRNSVFFCESKIKYVVWPSKLSVIKSFLYIKIFHKITSKKKGCLLWPG